ncbi:hypothetical protein [Mesorhizobium sp.]|uniref:hypothetical protein n=1 Tax=Mesorhizobium sp. TaxID=1871066 RepID=UPI00258021FD|nr:hypothetical protein [Mesorhizobium sp.]
MANKLLRKDGKLMIDESTPEFTEVGYDEPIRHVDEDIDVIVRREIEDTFSV